MAIGHEDGSVRIWDIANGLELRCLAGHSAIVYSVAFSPDGSRLASGSLDNYVRLYDVGSDQELRRLHVGSTVRSVLLHQAGRLPDSRLLRWDDPTV